MRIAVFGATGPTGRLLVAQALEEGDTVSALVRNPAKLRITNERLTVVTGELTDTDAIEKVVAGADGVISLLGQGRPVKGKPITRGTQNILSAMQKLGVSRIVAVATASAKDPRDVPSLRSRLAIGFARTFMRDAYDDVTATAKAIRESDRDWTIVRPQLLNDGPKNGHVVAGYLGDGVNGTYLARANAADFMLRQLRNASYSRQAPVVSNA